MDAKYRLRQAKMRARMRRGRQSGSTFWIILLLVLVLVVLYGSNQEALKPLAPGGKADLEATYTPNDLQGEIEGLLKSLEEVHPDLYARVSQMEINAAKERIVSTLTPQVTRLDFYRLVAPMVARFRDRNTFAVPPTEERRDYIAQGTLLFPLDLHFEADRVVVAHNYTSDTLVAPGALVEAINGVPIEQIHHRLLQYISGQDPIQKREALDRDFRLLQWLVFGFHSPYEVTIRRQVRPGGLVSRNLLGVTEEGLAALQSDSLVSADVAEDENFSYRPIPQLQTAVVGIRDFRDPALFSAFWDTTSRHLAENGVENLIVDLRNCTGYDTTLGDVLLAGITGRPFTQTSRVDVKSSKQIRDYYAAKLPWYQSWYPPFFNDFDRTLWETPVGEIVPFPVAPTSPGENPWRFTGHVYVLIGPNTFSAAVRFAATVKDDSLGTLVGEETGGAVTDYRFPITIELPETHLMFSCSTQRHLRANGEDDNRGVLPDEEVQPREIDVRRGVDTVLEHIFAAIRAERRAARRR